MTKFFESLRPCYSRAMLYVVLAFVLVGLFWAGAGKVDVVATAPFRLAPLGRVNTVQSPRGGEIEAIGVREGDRVSQGQVLFRLRSRETWLELRELEQANVQLERAKHDLFEALPQRRRLVRETIAALEDRVDVMQTVMQKHREALEAYRAELGAAPAPESQGGLEADLKAEIQFRSAELEHLKRKYAEHRMLYEKRLISRVALDEARVRYFGALASLPGRMSEIHRHEATVQDLKRQILEARIDLDREVARATHAYEEAKLRRERAGQAVDRALEADSDLILAPEDGVVTRVLVNTVGQVADRGQVLATLAPASAPMVAEVTILNRDVGLIRPGQQVKLKYDAFAFQDYGIKRGWLRRISPDATMDEALGLVYRGVVELEETTVRVQGDEKPLMYGMKGTAELVTDRQSVLMLLLRPLRRLHKSATFKAQKEG